jgi:enoyl-CoA hydratase
MSFEHIILEEAGSTATLTINRPQVMNALNAAAIDELRRAVLQVRHDASCRALIVTGAGEKAFVAGADIRELSAADAVAARDVALRGQHVFDLIENLGKPVIAAVNGAAFGGGCELAMACTFRLAADTARLGQPEITLGVIPGYGGTQRLARLIGRDRAMDLVLTGRHVGADEAFRLGLVTRVVPAATLMDEAKAFATLLASKPAVAVRLAMDAINHGLDLPLGAGCRYEAALFSTCASTEDMREGTRAFLEKRPAIFKHR